MMKPFGFMSTKESFKQHMGRFRCEGGHHHVWAEGKKAILSGKYTTEMASEMITECVGNSFQQSILRAVRT